MLFDEEMNVLKRTKMDKQLLLNEIINIEKNIERLTKDLNVKSQEETAKNQLIDEQRVL